MFTAYRPIVVLLFGAQVGRILRKKQSLQTDHLANPWPIVLPISQAPGLSKLAENREGFPLGYSHLEKKIRYA